MFEMSQLPDSVINGLFAIIGVIGGAIITHAFKSLRSKNARLDKCMVDIAVLKASLTQEIKRLDETKADITRVNDKIDAAFRIMEGKQELRGPKNEDIRTIQK